jgi:hypothetical protein
MNEPAAGGLAAAPDEHLTDGWEPDAPADDTLVRSAVLAHAGWATATAAAKGRPWRRTDRWVGAYAGERGALTNMVLLLRPPRGEDDLADVVAEVGRLVPEPVPFFLLSPFPTPDLTTLGLARVGHPPLMVRPAAPVPERGSDAVPVREVSDTADLAVAERLLVEAYPMPEAEPLTTGEVLSPALLGGPMRFWLAYADDRPIAVSAAYCDHGVNLVAYVAALPAARGRGAGAAVTWAATLADPARPALLLASDDGRPVYERLGYLAIERWTAWLRPGGS